MTSDDENLVDSSILELFRSDVAAHKAALEADLPALRDGRVQVELFDAAIEAAFAVKGTAQIVGLDALAEFAGALHGCLTVARTGASSLQSHHFDMLLRASRLLGNICEESDEEVMQWAALHREEIDGILACFAEITSSEKRKEPARRPNEHRPSSAGNQMESAAGYSESEHAPPPPPFDSHPEPAPESSASMIDPVMLDIFRTEVASNAQILSEGLLLLESEPGAAISETLDALMRAAHSIKGAGRIVDLDPIVKVAHAMEDCFVAAGKGEISVLPQHTDVLLRSIDMLLSVSETAGQSPSRWCGTEEARQIDALVGAVRAISNGTFVAEAYAQGGIKPGTADLSAGQQGSEVSPVSKEGTGVIVSGPAGKIPPGPPLEKGGDTMVAAAFKLQPSELPVEQPVALPGGQPPCAVSQAPKSMPAGSNECASESSQKEPAGRGRMIRVAATKIECLIGLAGEVVVNTRWLPLFSDSLLALKKDQTEMALLLERLQEALVNEDESGKALDLVHRAKDKIKACGQLVAERMNRLNTFTSNTTTLSDRLYQEAVGVRMRPFADGSDVRGLPRMVRDLARRLGKKVRFEIVGRSTEVDRDILERLDAPLNHLIRNAVDHGIELPEERKAAGKPEAGTIRLQVEHRSGMLMIKISDDGRGIDMARLERQILKKGLASPELVERLSEPELMDFLFLPGFSTAEKVTEISGRGVGLDVVHSMVHEVGGVIRAFSKQGEGITFVLELPLTLSVIRTLLVTIAREGYAFPLARIDRCLQISGNDILRVEDRQYFRYDGRNIALVNIHRVLDIQGQEDRATALSVLVVSDRNDAYGLVVDGFLGECDLVVRPLDPRLGKVPNFSAAALLLDGTPVLIFDVDDLVCSINNQLGGKRLASVAESEDKASEKVQRRVLVVDDSITVRVLEQKMLEHKGYQVEVAVDGMDGWNAVRSGHYDMVISDVDMPRMNGIELITLIRQHPDLKSLPVIIISYKDKEEDKLAGLQAGANYYLTKSSFQDHSFINAVIDLIGEPYDTNSNS